MMKQYLIEARSPPGKLVSKNNSTTSKLSNSKIKLSATSS